MKLTTVLYGIILGLAVENAKYYTLAAKNDPETPPPKDNFVADSEMHPDGSRPFEQELHKAPPAVSTPSTTTATSAPGSGAKVSTPNTTAATSTATTISGGAKVSTPSTTAATSTSTSTSGDATKPITASTGNTGSTASLNTSTTTTTSTSGPIVSPGFPLGGPTVDSKLTGDKQKKIIKDGCNFYDKLDLGIKPFGEIKGDKTVCSVKLNEEFDAFMYACDGTSDPPRCPDEVKTEEGVVSIKTLFSQVTVTNESARYVAKPNLFHVITGKANKPFSASCVCTKGNGTKETMELSSSFKQAGIFGILGLLVVYLMK